MSSFIPLTKLSFSHSHSRFASDPKHGKKFTHCKGWRKDTWGSFDDYLRDQFREFFHSPHSGNSDGICTADDDDDADEDSEVESDTIALEFDDNGYPILPSRKDLSFEQMKQYIRRYVTAIYRECSFFNYQNSS